MSQERTEGDSLTYAFGHMVSSHHINAHSGDSGDLAEDALISLGMTEREKQIVRMLAEHVAFNYQYTGEGEATTRAIQAGEL